ncbi:chromosome segregation protein smc [Fusarium austroafricanum]|uniref:Chromosome segregation protein smc n=1 Tax=Fusarium austroafricanum TaxID=2364996 RepID=A0A8H4P2U0_9HYPO|nr:chromosome segregation protein smc [Fusarium austroafricanum]
MGDRSQHAAVQTYTVKLDQTLQELQQKVRQHEDELEKLRSGQVQSPGSVAGQARLIQAALKEVTESEPFLPSPASLLPTLLALRKTHQTIQESNTYLASQHANHEELSRQLDADEARLKDQNLLGDALTARIQSLRDEVEASTHVTPEEGAKELLQELRANKKSYDRETSKLMKVLIRFIDNHLAPMLAAEELGGPVVGDLVDVDRDALAAGFSAQGKLKKPKDSADKDKDDKRQRRIDEIWGQATDGGTGRQDEVTAASAEMKQLTEELLNTLADAHGDNSASYVQLPRESAAARFLVRSKVAQFHPRDATRLKLVDFGRDLEA